CFGVPAWRRTCRIGEESNGGAVHQRTEVATARGSACGECGGVERAGFKTKRLGGGRFHACVGLPPGYQRERVAGVFEAETRIGNYIFADPHCRNNAAGELPR